MRDLFSTNPKANTAPRAPASAATLTAATVATATAPPPAAAKPAAPAPTAPLAVAPIASAKVEPAKPTQAAAAPPAAAPAVASAPSAAPVNDGNADVLAAVNSWAKQWAGKNAEGYLAAYSKSFKPEDGLSRSAWSEARRERIAAPKRISVELLGTTVEMLSATEAKVTFRQAYSSDALQTRSRKTLTLVKEGASWRIVRERVG